MINCLSNVFSDTGFLQTLDGLPVNKREIFFLEAGVTPEILRLYVDVTSRLGVEISAMALPLVGTGAEDALTIKINPEIEPGRCQIGLANGGIEISAGAMTDLERGIAYFASCYPYDGKGESLLERMEETGIQRITGLSIDTGSLQIKEMSGITQAMPMTICLDGESESQWGKSDSYEKAKHHFKQNLDVRIVVDEDAVACSEAILCTALRFALENYETISPYGVDKEQEACRNIRFSLGEEETFIENADGGLTFHGSAETLTDLSYGYAGEERDPFASQMLKDLAEILSCKNEIGQALETMCRRKGKEKKALTLITREYTRGMVDRKALEAFMSANCGETEILNFNDGKEIYHDRYQCRWEGTDFLDSFYNQILPLVKSGNRVSISGRLSEDEDVRRELEKEIRSALLKKGAASADVVILRSFKSGYSWIEEQVIPTLEKHHLLEDVASVQIRFPYLLNERGDDTFEDESTPNYGKHQDDPLKFFDIPTRWLQELFPVDELLAEKLSISTDQVEFVRDDALPCTYVLACFDAEGNQVYEEDFDVKYRQKNYMEKYPQIGRTHVTCGWLHGAINGTVVLEKPIVSDPEKVWGVLEDQIIPKLEGYLLDRYGAEGLVDGQPLFNRLQLNISMSEMDLDLGYRQERISTVEALQEDIYFYLLDWFKTYGERQCGRELDNVGLIMPEPEIRKGEDTQIEVILYDDLAEGAQMRLGEDVMRIEERPVELLTRKIIFEEGKMCQYIESEDPMAFDKLNLLDQMIQKGVIDFYLPCPLIIRMERENDVAQVRIPEHKNVPSTLSEEEKNSLLENQVVDYEQYLDLLRYYEGTEEVEITPVETTYKGRKIFSISLIRRREGVFYGDNKLKSERISVAFTARHHGNEASSLNSTFCLLDRLLSDMNHVLDKVNVILVPFINIDGGMLHCQVQRKHPKWLCHPARYNSAGFEFRKDFNNPHSIYGEARLLGSLWKEYLFDIITDNHGFEGHELCQPFSGYISPWYKSFWVPRAFYYGYVWYKGDAPHMVEIGSRVRKKVCDAINGDDEIRRLNLEFADRFYKYAEKWFPELFKLDRFEDVVFYWIDTNEKPRAANYGISNPEITALDWTTEVADETAVGEYMGLNVHAHHLSDLAVFQVLEECPLYRDCAVKGGKDGWNYSRFRRHPLFPNRANAIKSI